MSTHSDEPKNRPVVYIRRSQKGTTKKQKEPQEIQEANLFVIARKPGFKESDMILF